MNLWPWKKREAELDEEVRIHLDMAAQARAERGVDQKEAERAARREFGNVELVKETARDQWSRRWLGELGQDLRFGLRSFRRNPGFTAVAILTLALGIGANTAIFSAVNSVLLQPLPFRAPDRLVRIFSTRETEERYPVSGEDYFDWQSQNRAFEATSLFAGRQNLDASGAGEPETVSVSSTEANFFSLLGVQPMRGRTFLKGEDRPGNDHVAILSHAFWERHFGGLNEALGKTIDLNFQPYTIVGIMPQTFNYPEATDMWIPLEMTVERLGHRGDYSYRVLARLRPGVTLAQAQGDMSAVTKHLEKEYPITNSNLGARVVPMKELLTGETRPQLLVLLGAVSLVLLVACANVANLLLARATVRQREVALRATLGASRWRLMRQFATESVLLSLAGAALGLAGAFWLVRVAQSAQTLPIPRENPIRLDLTVLLFTITLSLVVGILFGLAPALQISGINLNDELKSSGAGVVGAAGWPLALRNGLVVAEIAASLGLLTGAGLLLRSFAQMRNADIGAQSQSVLTAAVVLPNTKYKTVPARREFNDRLLEEIKRVPGVLAASISQQIPLEGSHTVGAKLEGDLDPQKAWLQVEVNYVSPGYFHVFAIPFLSGRDFAAAEIDQAAEAGLRNMKYSMSAQTSLTPQPQLATFAVINRTMSQKLWPNQDAVGRVFISGVQPVTVVGVVGDVRYDGIREPLQAQAYFPLTQQLDNIWYPDEIAVRASNSPDSVLGEVRAALSHIDSGLSLFRVRTMQQVISDNMQDTTLQTILLGSFAALGLVLSAVGIYGVMAYLVTQRTHEIGLRVALGAQQRDILQLVVGRGSRLTFAGVAIGVVLAFALTRLLSKELFGVTATDPLTFVAVSSLLTLVALAACYIPARRAMRLDPLTALRYE